jgi:serine/threonine protein kinase
MLVGEKKLGAGTYGTVYSGYDADGNDIAIKCYKTNTADEGIDVGTLREIVYLKSLPPHENLIRILAVEWDDRQIRVGMPRYATDLHAYMKEWQRRKMTIPAREARLYLHQILRALGKFFAPLGTSGGFLLLTKKVRSHPPSWRLFPGCQAAKYFARWSGECRLVRFFLGLEFRVQNFSLTDGSDSVVSST